MKKAVISIVVLLLLVGISVAAFVAVKSKSDKQTIQEESALADNVLFDMDSGNITRLDITNTDGDYTFELRDEKWVLTANSGTPFEVNQVKVQGICTFISNLTAFDNYGSVTDDNKAQYGLGSPYVVTVYENDNTHTLYIGSLSPTKQYYYAYTGEKNNVYAIAAADANSILSTRLSLKDDKIIPYASEDIVGMKLVRNGEEIYDLTYDTDNRIWKLPQKYELLTIDQTKISSITALISRLTAEEMLPETDDDMTIYGFDKPIAEFTVKSSDGTEKTLLFSKYGSNAVTYTHVYNTEAKQVETFYAGDLDFIDKTPIDFIMKNIECANMYSVSEFEIASDALNEKFSVNANEGWAEFGDTRLDLTNAEIQSYFTNFFNSFAYFAIEDIDVEVSPELDDPIFTANYTDINGINAEYALVPSASDGLCYVFKDGDYTGTLTSDKFVLGSDSASKAFELLCRQAGVA